MKIYKNRDDVQVCGQVNKCCSLSTTNNVCL